MRVKDLIAKLERFDEDADVRFASQPQWPLEYSIGKIVESEGEDGRRVVYIAEKVQIGYLPDEAVRLLGWGRQ